jgi:hypothetical protein
VLVPFVLATCAVTARWVPGHQAKYQPFLTVAPTELPSLRVIVTPVTPAPIGPSTIVNACPSESDSPAPLSSILPAGILALPPPLLLELIVIPLPERQVEPSA